MGNIVAIIQARTGSSRLPGKVLMELAGKPMLMRIVERCKKSKLINKVVIATSTAKGDNKIEQLCKTNDWHCFRGSESDVTDRFYQASLKYEATIVVRITADCPLIDAEVIDDVIKQFLNKQPDIDYCSNILPHRTFPRGLDTEVFSFEAIERSWKEDDNPEWREHVDEYILHNQDTFKLDGFLNEKDYSYMRWVVDTEDDLKFIRKIYESFGDSNFGWQDVINFIEENQDLLKINKDVQQKEVK
ncbi:MAG: glycosyltransferase family protein [Candidatus Omnitrophica bacterium]|nr:glycosyltransferase family protein [Candidatus Omnitrophota bacterium]